MRTAAHALRRWAREATIVSRPGLRRFGCLFQAKCAVILERSSVIVDTGRSYMPGSPVRVSDMILEDDGTAIVIGTQC